MFRRIIIIPALVIALAATSFGAQRLKQLKNRREGLADQRLERIEKKLNLNDSQINGIRALTENRQKEMDQLEKDLMQKRQALRSLMRQRNANPSDIGNATLELKETRERAKSINQRFLDGVKSLLSADQQQRLPKRLK